VAYGETPLELAVRGCHTGQVTILLAMGCEPTKNALQQAVKNGDAATTRVLLAGGAQAWHGCLLPAVQLVDARLRGEVVWELLAGGAVPGQPSMMTAVELAANTVIFALVMHGGRPDSEMLRVAVAQENAEAATFLLDHGAQVSAGVMRAVMQVWRVGFSTSGRLRADIPEAFVELSCKILRHGGNPDTLDLSPPPPQAADGVARMGQRVVQLHPYRKILAPDYSILGAAVASGNMEVVEAVLAAGADPFRPMSTGAYSPMHLCIGMPDEVLGTLAQCDRLSRWTRRRSLLAWKLAVDTSIHYMDERVSPW